MSPKHGIVCLLCLLLTSLVACQRQSELTNGDYAGYFDKATEELVCFNFQVSYDMFAGLLEVMPVEHELYYKSLYARATCAQHITPPTQAFIDEATALFELVANECPDQALAGQALINLGRIAELRDYPGDETDMDKAREYYDAVITKYPDQELADQAAIWKAGTYIMVVDDKESKLQGVKILEDWLAKRPDNAYASPMWTYLGQTYELDLKDNRRALECFVKADAIGLPAESTISAYYWRIAIMAQEIPEKLDTCIDYYQKIIKITPTSGRAFEAQLALKELAKAHPDKNINVPDIDLYQIGQ
ncbi:MAG: tetratricopeptide repeat protein [Phycisphaeraceae bacterium JB051]